MPKPFDLLSEKLDDQADPDDQLRLQLGQDQGANLAGGPQADADGQPQLGAPAPGAQPMAPSPNVPGPLAALARKTPTLKPHIKLKSKPLKGKPKIKLKSKPMKKGKPKIKLKSKPAAAPRRLCRDSLTQSVQTQEAKMPYAGPFSLITGGLLGQDNPRDDIANWANEQQRRNRAAVGLDANGNPLPVAPAAADPNNPVNDGTSAATGQALASGVMPVNQQPNATKSDQSLGALLMNLTQYQMREQGFNQAMGMGFAAVSQPRDREMVSKMFNVNEPDVAATGQMEMNAASQQQGQDRMNSLGLMLQDPKQALPIATALNMPGDTPTAKIAALQAAYRADPQNIGRMITQTQLPTPDVANLEQIQRLQQKGANSSETALLTPALIAKIGGPAAEKAIGDAAAYRTSHKGQIAPWVTPGGVDIQAYNQWANEQKLVSDNQADAGSTFQASIDKTNTLREKLTNFKNDPDLERILALPQDSLEKNAFQEALRNQNADWKDKIPQVLLIDPGAMRALSDLKEATGQEYSSALDSILGHGLRPTAQEIAQVRAGYGQTPNILNFSSLKDYNAQAIDPMLTRLDEAQGKAYGDAGMIEKAPDHVKPFINPIYLHGGKYHLDDGTDVSDWEKNVNKPMSDQDVQDAKAAIKANPANAWHVVDGIRRKGYNVSPLAGMPGIQ